jgi:FkbM family methyltransferase
VVKFTTRKTAYHNGGCSFYVDIFDKRVTPVDAYNFNFYEREESEMLFRFIKDGDVIFDIGANIGWYSCHLGLKHPRNKIYSFEPIPETFEKLEKNVKLNNIENINLFNIAFSDKKEKLDFFYSPLITGASSSKNITENDDMKMISCDAETIDAFIVENGIGKVDFVKCDVEGAELFVFKGGFEMFREYKPIIFTEMLRKWAARFGYHPNDIIDNFNNLGYNCYTMELGRIIPIKSVNENTFETNFLFLHSKKHEKLIFDFT